MKRHLFVPSVTYPYLKARELEGTLSNGSSGTGCYLQTAMRVVKGWGCVSDKRCPAITTWPPAPLEPSLDSIARYLCVPVYTRVRTKEEVFLSLVNELPVCASFYINPSHWRGAARGLIDQTDLPNVEAHCVLLVDCDPSKETLKFRNSWGAGWGDQGYGEMTFGYFESHQQDAYISLPPVNPTLTRRDFDARQIELPTGTYSFMDRRDETAQESIGWSIIKHTDSAMEIEELYIRPAYRKNGHATLMLQAILDMAKDDCVDVIAWIGLADLAHKNASIAAINALSKKFALSQKQESFSWAKYSLRKNRLAKDCTITSSSGIAPGNVFDVIELVDA